MLSLNTNVSYNYIQNTRNIGTGKKNSASASDDNQITNAEFRLTKKHKAYLAYNALLNRFSDILSLLSKMGIDTS